jgi:adenosylcobinamide-GDP ribazoletransferase
MPLIRLTDPLVAASLLTRLPVPVDHAAAGARAAAAGWAWPLVGAALGALAGGALAGAQAAGVAGLAAAATALAVQLWSTGALHEDGLADCADGWGGGFTPERRLEIMRDSRVGAYGAAALTLALLARAGMLATLSGWAAVAALAAAGAVSRAALPAMMRAAPAARPGGLAASVGRPAAATVALAVASGALLAALLCGWAGLAALVAAAAAAAATLALSRRMVGGVTGDALGAAQVMGEIAALAVLTA